MRDVLVAILLAAGVAIVVFCCVGVLVMRGTYVRLHYGAPAGLGAILIALAVFVREGFSLIGDKSLLLGVFVLLSSPALSHVTARAAHQRAALSGSEGDGEAAA